MKQTKRKHIGIIGGVGPQATLELYRFIILYAERDYSAKNNDDYPDLLIRSLPIPDFISSTDQLDIAKQMLIKTTSELAQTSPLCICIASNTVHLLLNTLQQTTKISFLSMIDLVVEETIRRGIKKVGVLGTSVSIQKNIYSIPLKQNGITCIIPTSSEIVTLDNVIRNIIAGEGVGKYRGEYIEIVDNLFKQGAEAIILGCTELPMAINYEAVAPRMINSMEVLAKGIVKSYYEQN